MLRVLLLTALALSYAHVPLAGFLNVSAIPSRAEARPGEREVKALAQAWPADVTAVRQADGDWELQVHDSWFSWAGGRLLPAAAAGEWRRYAAVPFYAYPLSLPSLPHFDDPTAAALHQHVAADLRNPPHRSEAFYGTLLDARDRASTEADLVRMEVAGFTVTVHRKIQAQLAEVSRELQVLRKRDPAVAAFLKGLAEMNGYNYRFVEGTRSRSLHSYGLAIDLIPKSYKGLDTYWLWAMNRVRDWWTVPYERRWMPPAAVIDAFVGQGFVWGGKWLYFDTMHFEYRPEILAMARAEEAVPAVAEMPES
jgi:hypothetical protein